MPERTDGSAGIVVMDAHRSPRRGAGGYLRQLVTRFVSRIKGLAPLVLALGCENARPAKQLPAPPPATAVVAPAPAEPAEAADADQPARPIGSFDLTFYYVIGEDEVMAKLARRARRAANSNETEASDREAEGQGGTELAAIAPAVLEDRSTQKVTLYHGKSCRPIAEVTREFASQLALQGTGKLTDGRVLNVWGPCGCAHSPCFKVTETTWGTSGTGRPLQPFRTVAVDRRVIKLGTLLYLPELEGKTMPGRAPWGGFVHDGCVVADDTGGGIKGHQIDLFVARKPYVDALSHKGGSHAWARNVPVYDGSKICERSGRKVSRKSGSI